jgi:iron complex transport system substrate-binding protein
MNAAPRNRALSIVLLAVFGTSPACRRDHAIPERPATGTAAREGKTADPESWPVEVLDSLGRKVTVARLAERIVSLAPSNTEILHAIGAGRQVIGGTTFDNYPPEARSHTSIGGMTPKSINLEAITALRPDLVLATGGVQEPVIAPLERLGLTVVALDAPDFASVVRNIRTVGRLTGHAADAEQLATGFLDRVAAVGRRVAARKSPRPRVLYLLYEDPLMTAGPATFIGQMIEAAGGTNVFGDVTARYPRPSEEEILARAPEVILCTHGPMNKGGQSDEARRQSIRARAGWDRIPAVRENRIEFLEEDLVTRPGPRLVEGLEAVAKILEATSSKPGDLSVPAGGSTPR